MSEEEVDYCGVVIDEDKVVTCDKEAHSDVLVRTPFGLFLVPICQECKVRHTKFYANRRRGQPRRRNSNHRASAPI